MRIAILAAVLIGAGLNGLAQQAGFDRQPRASLDTLPPSARVTGVPGKFSIGLRDCRAFPAADVRRRIIQIAAQEWGYFGFAIVDRTDDGSEPQAQGPVPSWRNRRIDPVEAARVNPSIAGYWTVTPDGGWILDSQNALWRRPGGDTGRWRYAWSAAFISWVMCEGGLASMDQFQRDVAHHRYIDQAIRARDGKALRAAYEAHEPGEVTLSPGDLVCSARRPAYRTLTERRRQMGVGARTHCDVIVHVDAPGGRVLAIGGNVRGTVGLKAFPAARVRGVLRIVDPPAGSGARPIFAHLALGASYAAADPFAVTPAVRALSCAGPGAPQRWRTAATLMPVTGTNCLP